MRNKNTEHIYNELKSVYQDLKAEVYISEVMENSDIDFTDVDIFNQSTFSRGFRRDIINIQLDAFHSAHDKLQLNLSRNGLYDILPEGLFHDPLKTTNKLGYSEIRSLNKQHEKEARSFFNPIENEFFIQKVHIEQKERELINEFTNLKNDFLLKFWNLDPTIPSEYSIKLLQLLPFAHKISGNLKLTEVCLGSILGEKVNIRRSDKTVSENIDNTQTNNELGIDFILDLQKTSVAYPHITLTIGPISKKNVNKYIPGSLTQKFISIFCDYFIPIEMTIDTKTEFRSTREQSFVLNNETNNSIMGLSTIL